MDNQNQIETQESIPTTFQNTTEIQPDQEILIQEINVNHPMPEGIAEVNDFFETLEKIREHQQMILNNENENDLDIDYDDENEEDIENDSSSEETKKPKKKKDKKKRDKKKDKKEKKDKDNDSDDENKEKKDKKKKKDKKDKKEKKEKKEKKDKKKERDEKKPKKVKKLTKDQIIKGIKSGELVIVQSDQYDKLLRGAHKLQKRILKMIPLDKK